MKFKENIFILEFYNISWSKLLIKALSFISLKLWTNSQIFPRFSFYKSSNCDDSQVISKDVHPISHISIEIHSVRERRRKKGNNPLNASPFGLKFEGLNIEGIILHLFLFTWIVLLLNCVLRPFYFHTTTSEASVKTQKNLIHYWILLFKWTSPSQPSVSFSFHIWIYFQVI